MAGVITALVATRETTTVVIDHDLEFMSRSSTRLVVLSAGRKVTEGNVDDVLSDARVVESYIGSMKGQNK
jgi:branched-chain amino acid transport system ATP-binding protein